MRVSTVRPNGTPAARALVRRTRRPPVTSFQILIACSGVGGSRQRRVGDGRERKCEATMQCTSTNRCTFRSDLNRRMRLSRSRALADGIFGPVVHVPMLSMNNTWHDDSFRGSAATQLSVTMTRGRRWRVARNGLRKKRIAAKRSPEVMSNTIDVQKDFVEMPLVTVRGRRCLRPA